MQTWASRGIFSGTLHRLAAIRGRGYVVHAPDRTIYALSTPPGRGGVGVVRISGPDSLDVWRTMVKSPATLPDPWKMHRCDILHPTQRHVLDNGLAVFFKGPRSFTTEDVLELHVHSGRAIISSVLGALGEIKGCRPAEPGEFTRRAFLGGRLDLTQVEGLKDLINADTESQRNLALLSAEGSTRARYEHLRKEIIKCLAYAEALIDFGEGDHIEDGLFSAVRGRVEDLCETIRGHLADSRRGEIVRSGIRLTIFGPPNAGKSSLLNFFAQRDAAIVTPVPGTTRDILELSMDIGGLPVVISDTAGVRPTEDIVEKIGIERAKKAVQEADISLCVLSLPDANSIPPAIRELVTPETVFLYNKQDLISSPPADTLPGKGWKVSLTDGSGTSDFLAGFASVLQEKFDLNTREAPLITHARHRTHLRSALESLEAFLENEEEEDVVLGAEELRYAAKAIGRVTGIIDVEELLDTIFSDFCIGK
ncbi:tRNA modification GTPase TrmE [Cylindrobasidium torrendii FP15055 ss-10]|uniref:tRNA modification GTPase TrmE n=1 Tax=Cylindrobasidium torrendii FP15055 ss-10 TaxID=1314674 RepID=A0A0D7BNR7_9AGAR|nr:tRNA modification GTPase TrmE [Cylindrobasidium torrendii FP15055 ss-10]